MIENNSVTQMEKKKMKYMNHEATYVSPVHAILCFLSTDLALMLQYELKHPDSHKFDSHKFTQ